jgi:phage/plasmid-associated DNA primase
MEISEQFFMSLAGNDVDKYNQLLNFSKEFITGTQKIPVMHLCGGGSNGKTTLINLLVILAEQNGIKTVNMCNNNINMSIFEKYGIGIRYIIIQDVSNNKLNKMSGMIKMLTGGDSIYCKDPNHKLVTFKPKINFVIESNVIIKSDDCDCGLLMRIKTINMNATFNETNKDLNIMEKLLNNKNEIIQFIMNYKDK